MTEVIFRNRKYSRQKLISYGFEETAEGCIYKTDIAGGELSLTVKVTDEGRVFTRVNDVAFGEEYVLHLVGSAGGEFVGRVKAEYTAVLDDISERAFDNVYFSSVNTAEIFRYMKERYGCDAEFPFDDSPDCAVWRMGDNAKWFAILMSVKAEKLGIESDENVDIINLKNTPERIDGLICEMGIFRAYHMNKKHWITVLLDGSVQIDKVFSLIDESYGLVREKHKKKKRRGDTDGNE